MGAPNKAVAAFIGIKKPNGRQVLDIKSQNKAKIALATKHHKNCILSGDL
jgi:hypothetical protein